MESVPSPPKQTLSASSYVWLALAGGAIFATCRFPGALPALGRGFVVDGFIGAIQRVAEDAHGEDWLIAWLIYPAIGLIFGGFKRLFWKGTNVARWMFSTTVVLAVLYVAENIILWVRHSN